MDRIGPETPVNPSARSADLDLAPRVLTVTELNRAAAGVLERSFPLLWVAGELSNLTRAASGHWYFTLKDSQACVRAVMFRSRAAAVDFVPREGMHVEVRALVTLYAARGDYQLNVEAMRPAGMGRLYEAFVRLRDRLSAEGLFEPARKRVLPRHPRRVGLITSPQAAALRDVLSTLRRRAPQVEVILYPSAVQGADAPSALLSALETAVRRSEVDVLILCRGGGSMEDLWAFNDEPLARAIASSPIPVVSGVGHETDFTIADFAADMRAATPTAAAELVCPPREELVSQARRAATALQRAMLRSLETGGQRLDRAVLRLAPPARQLEQWRSRLAHLDHRARTALRASLASAHARLAQELARLRRGEPRAERARHAVAAQTSLLHRAWQRTLAAQAHGLALSRGRLEAMNPQRVLERGYSLVFDEKAHLVTSSAGLAKGQRLHLRFADGAADAAVLDVRNGDPEH